MQRIRGKGKIFTPSEAFLGEIYYDITCKPSTTIKQSEWWGEIIPENGIMPVGNHLIQLDDDRRGPCTVTIKTKSSFGLVVDSFNIKGIGPLTKKKNRQ